MSIDVPTYNEIIKSLFYVALTILVAVIINEILRSFIKMPKNFENKRAHTYVAIARNTVTIIVYVITIYMILVTFGFNLTPLLASAGVIGVIIGISARTFIEDLINGFFLLTHESIAVGDYVKLDTAEGFIEKIGARTLTVRAGDGAIYIIPNGQVKMVINYSRHRAYMSIDLVVKSDQNIDKTIKAMNEALVSLKKDKEFGDSIYSGSCVEGVEEFKSDGKMLIRATIITRVQIRKEVARKFRYLAKKRFERYRVALV